MPKLDTFSEDEVCQILEHGLESRTRCALTRRLLIKPSRIAFLEDGGGGPMEERRFEKRGRASTTAQSTMSVLKIDVGATHVKIVGSGRKERREVESGPTLILKLKYDSSTNSLNRSYRKIRATL